MLYFLSVHYMYSDEKIAAQSTGTDSAAFPTNSSKLKYVQQRSEHISLTYSHIRTLASRRYIMPPAYLALALKIVFDWMGQGFVGFLLFASVYLYLFIGACYVILFDWPSVSPSTSPSDVESEVSPSDASSAVITNSGYYFSTCFYMGTVVGSSLGLMLVALRSANALMLSFVLQVSSVILLETALVFSKRASDEKRFQPLMLLLYFQVDILQSFLFLRVDVELFSREFFFLILVQQLYAIVKFGGIAGVLLKKMGVKVQVSGRERGRKEGREPALETR